MNDRRRSKRIELRIQLDVRKNGDVFSATSLNVSESGILIETNKVLDLDQKVSIRLILPTGEEFVGIGTVVRQQDYDLGNANYAIHWNLSEDQRQVVADWMANLGREEFG